MTDKDLQDHVESALDWEASIDAADIGVSAEAGVITLRGNVKTFSEKAAAERITLGVYGTKAVANELNVRPRDGHHRPDAEIAQAALSALKWNSMVPDETLTLAVTDGWITLKGAVAWDFQRTAAADAVRDLSGVRGVVNGITIQPPLIRVSDVKDKIESALKRSAEVDARRINVAVHDGRVTLSGNVHSWFERSEARRAAWSAPGVKEVDDHISIVP